MELFQPEMYWLKPAPGEAELEWDHPLTSRMIGCWLLNEGSGVRWTDLTRVNTQSGYTGTPGWGADKVGTALAFPATDNNIRYTSRVFYLNNRAIPFTVIAGFNKSVDSDLQIIFQSGQVTDSTYNAGLGITATNYLAYFYVAASSSANSTFIVTPNEFHIGGVAQYGTALRTFYYDGKTQNNTTSISSQAIGSEGKAIGQGFSNSSAVANSGFHGTISFVYLWSYPLAAASMVELGENPFAIFRLNVNRRFFYVAGGEGPQTSYPAAVVATASLGSATVQSPATSTAGAVEAAASCPSFSTTQTCTSQPAAVIASASFVAPTIQSPVTSSIGSASSSAACASFSITNIYTAQPAAVVATGSLGTATTSSPATVAASAVTATSSVGSFSTLSPITFTASSVESAAACGSTTTTNPCISSPGAVPVNALVGAFEASMTGGGGKVPIFMDHYRRWRHS